MTAEGKDKAKSKFRKSKLRMRSISPNGKLKIISHAQNTKVNVAPGIDSGKPSKTRSFLTRSDKSKSSGMLLDQLSKPLNRWPIKN
jgi:hypothetical protein